MTSNYCYCCCCYYVLLLLLQQLLPLLPQLALPLLALLPLLSLRLDSLQWHGTAGPAGSWSSCTRGQVPNLGKPNRRQTKSVNIPGRWERGGSGSKAKVCRTQAEWVPWTAVCGPTTLIVGLSESWHFSLQATSQKGGELPWNEGLVLCFGDFWCSYKTMSLCWMNKSCGCIVTGGNRQPSKSWRGKEGQRCASTASVCLGDAGL